MNLIRRVAVAAATTGAGLAIAVGPAATANAGTLEEIERTPWVTLSQGDEGYRVAAVRCFLDQSDHFDGCSPTARGGDDFTGGLKAAVKRYQLDKSLPMSGKVDGATWQALRHDVGLVDRGDERSDVVKGVQYALRAHGPRYATQGPSALVDGEYTASTGKYAKSYQWTHHIQQTGEVGPTTFRSLFAAS
ncbi:MAG: hypothetical protein GEV10_30050 [Streptosporangiales bacterium]|nr:hypothetical protein [Streptosporangiales bacterium]